MAFPPITAASLCAAMGQFDREYRGEGEWENWEHNENHVYAIRHEGKLYPVKQMVHLASGVPRSEFTGGIAPHDANPHVERLGFTIVTLREPKVRNPVWTRDELVLALDAYLRWKGNPPAKASHAIVALSDELNQLGAVLGLRRSDKFRNANGVYMKLMNFRSLDPAFTATGRKGLSAHGQLDLEVWEQFAGNPEQCALAAAAIRASLQDGVSVPESFEDEAIEAEEGRLLTYIHIRRERNRSLVEKKKAAAMAALGKLECEGCGFDFGQRYPGRGEGFIECHHEKPVSALRPGDKTKLTELRLVCANCHRMIHSRRPWLTLPELRLAYRAG